MKYESTIKKICEKTGCNFLGTLKLYEIIKSSFRVLSPNAADTWLLGLLKSKKTLIAVFGKEPVCPVIGVVDCFCHNGYMPPAWQYHHDQMGYTLNKVLVYYRGFLAINKGESEKEG